MGVPGAAEASVARQAPNPAAGPPSRQPGSPSVWVSVTHGLILGPPAHRGGAGGTQEQDSERSVQSRPSTAITTGAGGLELRGQVQPLPFVHGRPQPQGAGASLGPPGGKQGCRA